MTYLAVSVSLMSIRGIHPVALMLVFCLFAGTHVRAQEFDALKECTALSPLLDDIHTCMDNYLDIMDGNMQGITDFLAESLSGESLAGLNRSQQAFVEYRRQNCLWYLNFSSPRSEAEQIAKNCLANMSQQRLLELQALVTEESSAQTVAGFYVYGPERNSFQLCGSDDRYWLEGDNTLVSRAQQTYLSLATGELQVMHAVFAGTVDTAALSPSGHQGVFRITALIDISLPTESNCQLPANLSTALSGERNTQSALSTTLTPDEPVEPVIQDEPQQQLIAYFGAWLVDCTENDGVRSCRLEVALEDTARQNDSAEGVLGELVVIRQKLEATELELVFPGREIDSPTRIRWSVDAMGFGDIVGSDIRVDETSTRQLIPSSRFLRNELLPLMISGATVYIDVLDEVDDESGERFTATLKGLTRSLAFADEFVREAAQ